MTGKILALMPFIVITMALLALSAVGGISAGERGGDCAILLHGLGRTSLSMGPIEDALKIRGVHVWNETYPSMREKIEDLAPAAIQPALAYCRDQNANRIHFVTHSMGGILVRYYFQHNVVAEPGRVVMLSPPNKGSEVVDLMQDMYLYRVVMGPAAQQLGTSSDSLPNSMGPIGQEIGIITGDRSADILFSDLLPGDDDGKVSVDSARLEEMTDFLIVDEGHTFIMRDEEVIRQILHFLKHGAFDR